MKAVILAGGAGWRLSEETETRPKPMIEVGGRPLLWHIMKLYEVHGITDFVVCVGYKGHVVDEFFANPVERWSVTVADTGEAAMTGAVCGGCCPTSATSRSASLTATAWPTST